MEPRALTLGTTTVDLATGDVVRDGVAREPLTGKELALLAYLAERAGRTVSRDELLVAVWGQEPTSLSRTVDQAVRRLRKKVELRPVDPVHVLTVHGGGYRLELAQPARPAPAPAPAPAPDPRWTVPTPPTSFHGRTTELTTLGSSLTPGALVTLLGAGGAGKTRLATHVASTWDGPVAFCELADARDADQLVDVVGRTLGVQLAADPVGALGAAIAARGGLIVLDNAEQAVDAVASLVTAWRRAAPSAAFLVTSRERLRLAGETPIEVGPLDEDAAVALLVDRARATSPSFAARPEDADALRSVARRLDGLPLALELAAARTGTLSPSELQARLERDLAAIDGRARRDAPERQATMRRALDWSWDLLDDAERDAYAALSVFRGGFDADAFVAVTGAGLDVLDALVDRSLVRAARSGGRTRFLTYEVVREHAATKLDEGSPRRAAGGHGGWAGAHGGWAGAHRRYYLALGERLAKATTGPGGIAAVQAISVEQANLLAVLSTSSGDDVARAALALDPLLYVRGPVGLHRSVLDAAVTSAVDPVLRARALRARADHERQIGKMADARADAAAALELARAAGDRQVEAMVLATQCLLLNEAGRPDEGLAAAVEGERVARDVGDRHTAAVALSHRGIIEHATGRLTEAEATLSAARDALRDVGDRSREGNVLVNLGTVAFTRGRLGEAKVAWEEALAIARETGSRRREALILVNLASRAYALGETAEALALYERSYAINVDVGQRREAAVALGNLAWMLLAEGRTAEAEPKLRRTVELQREVGNRRGEGIAVGNLAILRHTVGDLAEAAELYDRATFTLRQVADARALAHFSAWKASCAADRGRREEADLALQDCTADDPQTSAVVAVHKARVTGHDVEGVLRETEALASKSAEVRRAREYLLGSKLTADS